MIDYPDALHTAVRMHPYPLVFATVSGAHLYGFASPDSDWDLRGMHNLPIRKLVGLEVPDETIELSGQKWGIDLDLVTHDARKYFLMLLKKNGYVLEQIFSPLVVVRTPAHEELREIARRCITRHHAHHYFGFSQNQWELYEKDFPRRVKPLLYVFRVLLTGIHLMRTGEIEANLSVLNTEAGLSYLDDLMALKTGGAEHAVLPEGDWAFYEREYHRLRESLADAFEASTLPDAPTGRDALDDLLIRLRLVGTGASG